MILQDEWIMGNGDEIPSLTHTQGTFKQLEGNQLNRVG